MEISKEWVGEHDGMGIDYKVQDRRGLAAAVEDAEAARLAGMIQRFGEENEWAAFRGLVIERLDEMTALLERIANKKPWYERLWDSVRRLWAGRKG